jgi:DNA-binding NarL/FixJ family response regulator
MLFIAVSDLMFQSRIVEAARALGIDARVADSASALAAAGSTDAAVIDLHDRAFDAMAAARAAKDAGMHVLAFGRHTEPALLRGARQTGVDIVVPRSQLVEELPQLLQELLRAGD